MKTLKQTLLAISFLAIFFLAGCKGKKKDFGKAKQSIVETSARLWTTHQNADADAFAAMVTEDVIIMSPDADDINGRQAVREFAKQVLSTMKISDFKVISQEIDLTDSLAYELTTYSEKLEFQGQEPKNVRGRYLMVWKQNKNGDWLLHRNLFNFYGVGTGH